MKYFLREIKEGKEKQWRKEGKKKGREGGKEGGRAIRIEGMTRTEVGAFLTRLRNNEEANTVRMERGGRSRSTNQRGNKMRAVMK